MLSPKLVKKQKHVLQIVFTAIFALSFVFLIFEKQRVDDYRTRVEKTQKKMVSSIVKGMSVDRRPGIAEYRDVIKKSLSTINSNINSSLQSEGVSLPEIERAYHDLMECVVPEPYKKMHIQITALANDILESDELNPDYLGSKREKLFARYPWLKKVVTKQKTR